MVVQVMDAVYDLLRATYDLRPSLSFSLFLLVLSFLSFTVHPPLRDCYREDRYVTPK